LTEVGAQKSTDAALAESTGDDGSLDILIVEDNLYDIDLMTHALRDHVSNRIKVVYDGENALDFLFAEGEYARRDPRQQPRLILLDLNLPQMGGLQVLQRIRADPRTKDIPVAILTHSKEDDHIIEGYRLGANSFLVKRHDFDEFMKAAQTLGIYWLVMNRPAVKPDG
jgi:two-component system, response regulator